jgi:hypothetical protein
MANMPNMPNGPMEPIPAREFVGMVDDAVRGNHGPVDFPMLAQFSNRAVGLLIVSRQAHRRLVSLNAGQMELTREGKKLLEGG